MKKIELPEKVTRIGDFAFRGCLGLKKIIIPETVTEFGAYAFTGCTSLTHFVLDTSVVPVGMFYGCTSLTDVYVWDGDPYEWAKIQFGEGNEAIQNADIHFILVLQKRVVCVWVS